MEEYRNINDWIPDDDYPGSAFVIGRFDGVHLGHRSLIDRAVRAKTTHGLKSVCFSFQECTYPTASDRGVLTTADEKVKILQEIGIDYIIQPEFKPPIKDMTPQMFLEGLLVNRWQAKKIIVGYDFHFGRDRMGDTDYLEREGPKLGVDIEVVSPFMVGDEIVKATQIRELISDGKVSKASEFLGRPYFVNVISKKGRGLGRVIGFPTINFNWPEFKVKPVAGIYAVKIESEAFSEGKLRNLKFDGVANLGFQPTIDPENTDLVLEVHILDRLPLHISLGDPLPIGASYTVEFHEFIRSEEKFGSVEDLKSQIATDCESARQIFQSRK